jgi:hypothetical protein
MMKATVKGTLVASLVAGLFGCGASTPAPSATPPTPSTPSGTTAQKIKCVGVNACRGQSDCGGIGDATCAGSNSCRGKGWLKATAEDCAAKGGKPL